jgi:hypothetical protein
VEGVPMPGLASCRPRSSHGQRVVLLETETGPDPAVAAGSGSESRCSEVAVTGERRRWFVASVWHAWTSWYVPGRAPHRGRCHSAQRQLGKRPCGTGGVARMRGRPCKSELTLHTIDTIDFVFGCFRLRRADDWIGSDQIWVAIVDLVLVS